MANIDLATYVAKVEVNQDGLKTGLSQADSSVKSGISGLFDWTSLKMGSMFLLVGKTIKDIAEVSVESYASMEEDMNKVFTLLPEMSLEAREKMTKDARELSLEVGKLPEEVIPAIYSALSAGVPQDNVFEYVEVASKGAVASGAETEEMVEGLASVINAYGMEATEAERISDIFFVTLKNGMTSIPELSQSLSQVTPIASAMGVEFEEVAGAMATMTAQGIPTSTAANQLKAMMAELGKEGTKSSDILKEISGKSLPEFLEEGYEFNDVLFLMEEYAKENNIALIDMFGSVQAGQGFLSLTGENAQSFIEDIDAMKDSAGATEEAFEKMNKGINRMKEVVDTLVNDIQISIGKILSPFLTVFYTMVIAGLKVLQESISFLEEVVGLVVIKVREYLDNVLVFLEGFAEEHSETLEGIKDTVGRVTTKIKIVIDSFLDIVFGVLGLFRQDTEEGTSLFLEAVLGIVEVGLGLIESILDIFITILTGDWETLGDNLTDLTDKIWETIISIISNALKVLVGILKSMFTVFFNTGVELFTQILTAAVNVMEQLLKWITTPIKGILRAFTSRYGEARSAGRGMFSAVWDGMKGIWSSIWSWVSDKVSKLTNALSFWKSGSSQVNSGGGGTRNVGSFATGSRLIKKDGFNLLHKGEMVVPADLNPFNPRSISKGGFYNDKFGLAGAGSNVVYDVDVNIDKVEKDVDIERAVDKGIERAERKRESRLKKRGM